MLRTRKYEIPFPPNTFEIPPNPTTHLRKWKIEIRKSIPPSTFEIAKLEMLSILRLLCTDAFAPSGHIDEGPKMPRVSRFARNGAGLVFSLEKPGLFGSHCSTLNHVEQCCSGDGSVGGGIERGVAVKRAVERAGLRTVPRFCGVAPLAAR